MLYLMSKKYFNKCGGGNPYGQPDHTKNHCYDSPIFEFQEINKHHKQYITSYDIMGHSLLSFVEKGESTTAKFHRFHDPFSSPSECVILLDAESHL